MSFTDVFKKIFGTKAERDLKALKPMLNKVLAAYETIDRLSDDELFALISRVTKLYAQQYGQQPRITEEQMGQFLQICLSRAGADSMITPREMLRDYMTVLNILMQNPEVSFETVVGSAVTLKTEAQLEEEREREATPAPNKVTIDDIDF